MYRAGDRLIVEPCFFHIAPAETLLVIRLRSTAPITRSARLPQPASPIVPRSGKPESFLSYRMKKVWSNSGLATYEGRVRKNFGATGCVPLCREHIGFSGRFDPARSDVAALQRTATTLR